MAVPMDKESVTRRLREVAELSHLCRQLAGPRWPYQMSNLSRLLTPMESDPVTQSIDCSNERVVPCRVAPKL